MSISTAAIHDWISSQLEAQICFLETVVNVNSHTTNIEGVNAVQSIFERELNTLGLIVERRPITNAGDFLVARTLAAQHEKPIMLSGHVDTVHLPSSAFHAMTDNGARVTGPGALDMKGGLTILLWALKAAHHFRRLQEIPVMVCLNSEEERGSPHTRPVIEEFARQCRSALVFEWGRQNHSVITRRKGISVLELRTTGRKSHSGNAHAEGRNAIDALSRAIIATHSLTDYDRGVTLSVNEIRGGSSPSTVPESATAMCDLRIPTAEMKSEILSKLAEVTRSALPRDTTIEIREVSGMPPLECVPGSLELLSELQRAGSQLQYTFESVPGLLGGASDANLIGGAGIPTVDGLGPLGDGAHTDDEFVERGSFTPRTAMLATWLLTHGEARRPIASDITA
jgi:glutamate carboxypeptidase